ncbi:hypothetical protein OsccyDRAFT_3611 [Leptolyngbyaceae cyanobacterium JSC-12]|nr:hypothetical protein OsccyDRAFT_3611 [Leptolyngbyaceae cyanobacterium JSC-12]
MSKVVLDASAMLAYLFDEDGADFVETALNDHVCVGAINWAEVLSKVEDKGHSFNDLTRTLRGCLKRVEREHVSFASLCICPHPPTPSPKLGRRGVEASSPSPKLGRGI